MISSRQTAFETLYRIFYEGAYSNIAVDNALDKLSAGKAFAARLIYGAVERKITLDYIIKKHSDKSKPKVMTILRMGVYQIYFMDKVPVSAAINESVNLARENGLSFYCKFINAVLHRISENIINIDDIADLSIKYSIPQNLINMWNKAYTPEKVEEFLPQFNCEAPVFLVPNSKFVDADELLYELNCEGADGEISDGTVKINSSVNFKQMNAFKNGLFHIQDLSCFKAVKALNPLPGRTIIDLCASPGGKSFTAASLTNDNARIISCDLYESRVNLIKRGAERLSLKSVLSEVNDASVFNPDFPKADYVICDVPCSGFGIIRRKPEIRYKNLDEIKSLPAIQYNILKNGSEYLKKGGILLYSTCTLNKKENEDIVYKFIDENKSFNLKSVKTFFPGENGGDGFFCSLIERIK